MSRRLPERRGDAMSRLYVVEPSRNDDRKTTPTSTPIAGCRTWSAMRTHSLGAREEGRNCRRAANDHHEKRKRRGHSGQVADRRRQRLAATVVARSLVAGSRQPPSLSRVRARLTLRSEAVGTTVTYACVADADELDAPPTSRR